ncbi:MAG: hypothetical protein KME01_14920 [Chroococcus sp. CMT-3BRIN-NPC107]|jgi:hypothetical protein|nr:hypothetical protein [Chroococcus sp. CMT-3BRIN-NPC107]
MRQIATTAFLGMLAITTTGCPSSNTSQSISPAPSPSTIPVVVQTPPPVKPPLVAQNPSSAAYLAPGLIQPTNANQRTKQVAKGNRDPFTALFLPVPVPPASAAQASQGGVSPITSSQTNTIPPTSRSITGRQSRPNSSVTINNPRTALNRRRLSNRAGTSIQNIPLPPNTALPNNNLEPALPPALPEPDLAKTVIVMGVVQIGEQTQAIVQVPSEATSRYVQVGQRLSNGQVLVKRIELNAGAEPLVILEQYGVEVSKAVGEQAPSQGQQATSPTAAVPYLPPPSSRATTAKLPAPPPNINTPETNIALPTLSSNPPKEASNNGQSK